MSSATSPDDTGSDPIVYTVRISPTASLQAVMEYDRLTEVGGTEVAEGWRLGLLAAWAPLATLPLRCTVAPEDPEFQKKHRGPSLHQLLYRSGRRSTVWRILFTAHPETTDDPPRVQIYQIRHGAQAPLTEWPADDED